MLAVLLLLLLLHLLLLLLSGVDGYFLAKWRSARAQGCAVFRCLFFYGFCDRKHDSY
jgi:hypothetical protein